MVVGGWRRFAVGGFSLGSRTFNLQPPTNHEDNLAGVLLLVVMTADKLTVFPGALRGELTAPPSKSMTQRVLAALLLRPLSIDVRNAGTSADEQVVMQVLRDAGFSLSKPDGLLRIEQPTVRHAVKHVEFGESGLAARMLIPILALQDEVVRLDALHSLRARPMRLLQEELPKLGVRTSSNRGFLPGSIHGPLRPADITLDGSGSSQTLTGLLMAYAGAGAADVTISVNGLVSKPYIDLTLQVMERMGLPVPQNRNYEAFYYPPDASWHDAPAAITIEGDWSGAAFLLVGSAIAGPVTVNGLDAFSTQGDKAILNALMECGAQLSIESTQVSVAPAKLKAFHFDATDTPDLFPPLAALACYADGTSVIEGVSRLTNKESNRAETIRSELSKMGADISLQDDLMIIKGIEQLRGAPVTSHNDHRIAMMCAIATLKASEPTTIDGAQAVGKSYPQFWKDLQRIGARIEPAR